MGTATQTLATQEQAARARTDQTMKALTLMDKLAGGPQARTLAGQKELETFRATLDTPERRLAQEKFSFEQRKQDFYERFKAQSLDIMRMKAAPDEKQKATALKTMTSLAKTIQQAESKAASKGQAAAIAPELYDAYALAAVQSGNGSTIMTYSPESSVWGKIQEYAPLGILGEPPQPTNVTAYEWMLLRDVELQNPDMPYEERVQRLMAARKKHGGSLNGPAAK